MKPVGKRIKILIVEDDGIIAMDLRETLEEAGYDIIAIAPDFNHAIEAVRNSTPDLALIDIRLENSTRDGIETAREILTIRRIPIIYLTANSEHDTFTTAKTTNPTAYLLKPFRPDELKFQVEMAFHNFRVNTKNPAESTGSDIIYLPIDKGYKKVSQNDVLYLSAEGSYVEVFLVNKETRYLVSTNLGNLALYFTAPHFFRLSRSLLINLNHLDRIERNHLFMAGNTSPIRIPTSGRKELLNKLMVVKTK